MSRTYTLACVPRRWGSSILGPDCILNFVNFSATGPGVIVMSRIIHHKLSSAFLWQAFINSGNEDVRPCL
jgi:hypothetical protein